MNRQSLKRTAKNFLTANSLLLLLLCFTIFGVTLLPESWYRASYSILINLILISIIFCLEKSYQLFSNITVTILVILLNIAFFTKAQLVNSVSDGIERYFFSFRVFPFAKAGGRIKSGDDKSSRAICQWLFNTGYRIFYGCFTDRIPSARSVQFPGR